jgi:hypothetical protein
MFMYHISVWIQGGRFVDTKGRVWAGYIHMGQSSYSMGLECTGFCISVTEVTTSSKG